MTLTVAIGSDHAGFLYKEILKKRLNDLKHKILDLGTHSVESADYPDFAHPVANSVETKESTLGVLICGSGNGVCMTANKHKGIRAALCWNTELAVLARSHNNANVLCIPARFISEIDALAILEAFLSTSFEGGRHEKRVSKI